MASKQRLKTDSNSEIREETVMSGVSKYVTNSTENCYTLWLKVSPIQFSAEHYMVLHKRQLITAAHIVTYQAERHRTWAVAVVDTSVVKRITHLSTLQINEWHTTLSAQLHCKCTDGQKRHSFGGTWEGCKFTVSGSLGVYRCLSFYHLG